MSSGNPYHRFDPVTVRAAARLVYMGRAGRLADWEVRYYVRQLTAMMPGSGRGASRGLRRLAERRAALGHTGAPAARRLRRCSPSMPAVNRADSTGRDGVLVGVIRPG